MGDKSKKNRDETPPSKKHPEKKDVKTTEKKKRSDYFNLPPLRPTDKTDLSHPYYNQRKFDINPVFLRIIKTRNEAAMMEKELLPKLLARELTFDEIRKWLTPEEALKYISQNFKYNPKELKNYDYKTFCISNKQMMLIRHRYKKRNKLKNLPKEDDIPVDERIEMSMEIMREENEDMINFRKRKNILENLGVEFPENFEKEFYEKREKDIRRTTEYPQDQWEKKKRNKKKNNKNSSWKKKDNNDKEKKKNTNTHWKKNKKNKNSINSSNQDKNEVPGKKENPNFSKKNNKSTSRSFYNKENNSNVNSSRQNQQNANRSPNKKLQEKKEGNTRTDSKKKTSEGGKTYNGK